MNFEKETLPNFLIVGAPRCGTTAMYNYLDRHPQIFMSPVKEPCFFSLPAMKFPHKGIEDDVWERSLVTNLKDYKSLFAGAKNEVRRGEASPDYLFRYETAIPGIRELLGDITIIIMVRNPVDRAFSAYWLLRKLQREHLSFEEALEQEQSRIDDNYSYIWHYQRLGHYSQAIMAYQQEFSTVGVFLFEDFKREPTKHLCRVYQLLNVNPEFQQSVATVYNASGEVTSPLLFAFLTQSNPVKAALKPVVDLAFPETKRRHLIEDWKSRLVVMPKMKTETRRRLISLYRDDILKFQELIGRDLRHWLEEDDDGNE